MIIGGSYFLNLVETALAASGGRILLKKYIK